MNPPRSKRLSSALVPMGVLALVAGCGGGGAVSNATGGTTFVPPSGKQMSTATLSLLVPGRRPSAGSRTPRYVSPYTSRVDVSAVAAGAASPWPVATSTSIPTPGPVPEGATPTPIPVTMTVPVAVGSDQFLVNAYDSSGYLLSGLASGPVTISANAANNVNLVLNAAADCVRVNGVTGGAVVLHPLENQMSAQTSTFTVTPCDADGYPIPAGQSLSNALTFATPAPVNITVNSNRRHTKDLGAQLSFSPSSITTGGTTLVTATYPAQTNAVYEQQVVPSPMPPALYGGLASVTADPLYLVMVANSDMTASLFYNDIQGTTPFGSLGTVTTPMNSLSIIGDNPMHGCAGAGQAVIFSQGYLTLLNEPAPTAANPIPTPVAATQAGTNAAPSAPAMDLSCNVYVGDSAGYVSTLTSQMSSFTQQQYGGNYATNGSPPAAVTSVAWLNPTVGTYVGLGDTSGYMNNIVNLAGADQLVGPHTAAMTRLNSTTLMIAYQQNNFGDYYLAQWTPGGSFNGPFNLSNSYSNGVTNIVVDGNGEVWTAAKGCLGGPQNLYKYDPGSNSLTTYSIGSGCSISPSAIAAGPDGTLFIVNDGDQSSGFLHLFSWQNITGGAPTNVAAPIASPVPLGNNPVGITLVP